jgi:hypothetical protein
MMICPKCSRPAAPDRVTIEDEKVYQCTSCDLYTVENGARWVEGGPYLIGELRIIAESRDRDAKANAVSSFPCCGRARAVIHRDGHISRALGLCRRSWSGSSREPSLSAYRPRSVLTG